MMVTLILLFIFITPHLWNYGDKPSSSAGLSHPIKLTGDGGHGMIVTVQASDVIGARGRDRQRGEEGAAPGD